MNDTAIDVHTGADEQIVALYPTGTMRLGTIRDLTALIYEFSDGRGTDFGVLPAKVYVQEGDGLAEATFEFTPGEAAGYRSYAVVTRNRYEGIVTLAEASFLAG